MLPRYAPNIAWPEALHLVAGQASEGRPALAELASSLLPGIGDRRLLATGSARQALLAHYQDLHHRRGPGTVLLPAQVCPVVPALIWAAGHRPLALDGDGALPTPGPQEYSEALAEGSIVGLLVAPMSGYVQFGWSALLPKLDQTVDLVLDLAQAPFSAAAFGRDFLERADAFAFSFRVGKGFDIGGGLLVSRHEIPVPGTARRSGPLVLAAVLKSAAIRAPMSLGAYRFFLPLVDRMAADDVAVEPVEGIKGDAAGCWLARQGAVGSEFERAGERSGALSTIAAVQRSCHAIDVTCARSARPLRQLLRLRPGVDRGAVLNALRAAGLDCAPAGEPFPVGEDPRGWPAAEAFTRDALRLPFLGRFSPDQFERAAAIIEEVLTAHGL